MKLIAQFHPLLSRSMASADAGLPLPRWMRLLLAELGWVAGFGASFGRSGSPFNVGSVVPAETTHGETVTVAVRLATVSAMRRNRV